MRLDPAHLLLPLLVLLITGSLLALHSDAEPSCRAAEEQLQHGSLALADQKFTALLEAEPSSTCANEGMDAVIEQRCEEGQAAQFRFLYTRAKAAYQAILVKRPDDPCAAYHFKRLVEVMCERAGVLAKRGASEAAAKAYAAILALEPLERVEPCPAEGLKTASSTATPAVTVIRGIDGKDGAKGTDGVPGKPGTDGKPGKDGTDGTNGRDGRDAAGSAARPWPG